MLRWGIGMIANSSTFHPHPWRVTGIYLFCLSHALQHASTSLSKIFGPIEKWCTLVHLFDNGANAASVSVQALAAVQALMLAVVALKQTAIECQTLCVLRGMNNPYVLLLWGVSDPRIAEFQH